MRRNIRKAGDIEPTPDRKDGANNGDESNHVTPRKEEPKSTRKNKDPKRTKKTQTLEKFFKKLETKKQENSQHTSVAQVLGKRTKGGKKLVPSGLTEKIRKEKAEKGRKKAEAADEGEITKKTISFGKSEGNNKPAPPHGSALKRGSREKIKTFKHEMVVGVKVKISYTRQKC